ncbi:MAG: response regulator [candidate division KSB1 bacterium]|nr:response regulator [candidate division KSB1 bacterium]MDZ7303020.1 response regulator [candidate division KSB1 bacterium]MDZ7312472.1 response regulator [candidate division KSB1 bacterium]
MELTTEKTTMAAKHKILVIDDEAVILDSARKILSAEGFEVRTAEAAESALDILQTGAPDAILIDLKLPGLSGMELLDIVRKNLPQVAAIMMTGYSTLDNAVTSLKNGAFDFLPKPFTFEELLSTVLRASRFIDLPMAERSLGLNGNVPNRYHLGMHSWTKIDLDGTAQLGITNLFQRTVGHITQIELPQLNHQIQQGNLLVRVAAEDQMVHTVWAALSGRVMALNDKVQGNPHLLNKDPFGEGWLVRIIPDNLENELAHLSA